MNIVIVDCFDTWEHRVDLLHKVFTEEGHKVRCIFSDFRHIEKTYRVDKKKDYTFIHAERYDKNISVDRLWSHIKLSRDIFSFLDRHSKKIDLLWVLAPPNVFIRDAARIKRRHSHIKLVIDLIDLWPETMPVGKIKPLLFPWRWLRDRNLAFVDAVVTECNLYRDVLGRVLDNINVHTLYLAREDKGYEPKLHLPDDRIVLCYLGSINNIIDIPTIGTVIEKFRNNKPVTLHIIGDGEKKLELIAAAEKSGAEIIYHGTVYDRTEKQQVFDSCHYGLNIMKKSVCVGLTMKSIDYFEFGLPVINNIHGDTWDAIEKLGCGINIEKKMLAYFGSKINNLSTEEHKRQRLATRSYFEKFLTEDIFRNAVIRLTDGL